VRVEASSINNFKQAGVHFGFTKEYLSKRIDFFTKDIYGES
jgi:hypothetical protein